MNKRENKNLSFEEFSLVKAMPQACRKASVTSEPKPNDFDACWEPDDVDMDYLRKNAHTLLNFSDKRAAQHRLYDLSKYSNPPQYV